MKKPTRFLLLLILFGVSGLQLPALAQKYVTAGGVRFEKDRLGLTVQQKVLERTTLQLVGVGRTREISAHLLGQQHFPIIGRRFNFYLGAGGHMGSHKDSGTFYGADLIVGTEYKMNGLPLLLSIDFKPAIHIGHENWLTPSAAFSLRYVFVKEKKPKLNFFQRLFKKDGEEDDD